MKKLIITAALIMAFGLCCNAQEGKSNVTVTKQGKTFTATKNASKGASSYTPTGYTYIDTDGEAYEIHTHTTQRGKNAGQTKCYIQRTSKNTGKTYWKAIPVKPEELKG